MFEEWLDTDFSELPRVRTVLGRAFSEDSGANKFGVRVTDNGEPIVLSGTVRANIIKPDGTTIAQDGSKSQNKAWVILPSSAYSLSGKISIVLKLINGTEVATLGAFEIYVR